MTDPVTHGGPLKCGGPGSLSPRTPLSVGLAIIRIKTCDNSDKAFTYGEIDDIFVYNDHKVFRTNLVRVEELNEHLRAIRITKSDDKHFFLYEDFMVFCM